MHAVRSLFAMLVLPLVAAAQDAPERRIEARVLSSPAPGSALIDRGRNDKLQPGDPVEFRPRQGGTLRGVIHRVDERTSLVDLDDRVLVLSPGVRCEVRVPAARFAPQPGAAPPAATRPEVGERPETAPTPPPKEPHPGWQNRDEKYTQDKPLLAQVQAVRPSERRTRISGRAYMLGELTRHPETDYDESFVRAGTDLRADNPFGDGGTFRVQTEVDYRTEYNDDDGLNLLVPTLSYQWGGTRFDAARWDVGRFLQNGMPEFGTLDGVEWSTRTGTGGAGGTFGLSFGYLPLPNDDFGSFEDMQFGAWYLWHGDEMQTVMLGGGVQKTLHDGSSDRDLIVVKGRYLPADAWQFDGTFWVDWYTGDELVKSQGFELTQAVATMRRSWQNGNTLELGWRHLRIPDTERYEWRFVPANEVADDRADRFWLDTSLWATKDTRWHAYVSGYNDEDSNGGAAEFGFDSRDWIGTHSQTDVTLFGNTVEFTAVIGARFDWRQVVEGGSWEVFYEVANVHDFGYPNDRDDFLQHRLRLTRGVYAEGGWDLSFYGEGRLLDEEISWTAGLYVNQSF
jgi:hypothetical protein